MRMYGCILLFAVYIGRVDEPGRLCSILPLIDVFVNLNHLNLFVYNLQHRAFILMTVFSFIRKSQFWSSYALKKSCIFGIQCYVCRAKRAFIA